MYKSTIMTTRELIHVYKHKTFGFADYLRAIYPLSQLATRHGYTYTCAFNHPLQELFHIDTTEYESEGKFTTDDDMKLLESILKSKKQKIIVESNYANWFHPVPKDYIKAYIKPSATIMNGVNERLKLYNLQPKRYYVFHIRCSDEDFHEIDKISPEFQKTVRDLRTAFSIIRSNPKLPIYIISSSPTVISIIHTDSGVLVSPSKPCHTGIHSESLETMLDTIIDFYIMEQAKHIFYLGAMKFAGKISGFSYWASQLFKVPFTKIG
jgi:hypothetical protein